MMEIMMRKIKTLTIATFIFAIIIVIAILAPSVNATFYATHTFTDQSGLAQTGVQTIAYECWSDNTCSQLTDNSVPTVNLNSGTWNSVTIGFPTRGITQYFGEYFYKQGYLPMHAAFYTKDTGNAGGNFPVQFQKAQNCVAPIMNLSVINVAQPNMPITINIDSKLSAETWSAFHRTGNLPQYVPAAYKDEFYSTQIRVVIEITNAATGAIVFTQTRDLNIFEDSSQKISTTWTPTSAGRYIARATTTVTDNQCSSSITEHTSKEFTIWNQNIAPNARITANPTSGNTPLIVNFNGAQSTDTDGTITTYAWNFGDGNTANGISTTHTYTTAGTYTTTLTVTDNQGASGTTSINIITTTQNPSRCYTLLNNLALSNPYPKMGDNLNITVNSLSNHQNGQGQLSSVPTNLELRIRYPSGAITTKTINTQALTTNEPITITTPWNPTASGQYSIRFTGVANSNLCQGIENPTELIELGIITGQNETIPDLDVQNIQCFSNVIRNGLQSCSITVQARGIGTCGERGNIQVVIRDGNTNQEVGRCVTDPLTGECSKSYNIGNVVAGQYSVYATAEKQGCIGDNDKMPTFVYNVMNQRYLIQELRIYNDSAFLLLDNTFFRNETAYASFRVIDSTTNQNAPGMVTAATIVSPPGGRMNLEYIRESNGIYYFSGRIPPTHEFLGQSDLFTFVFNFTDNSGGSATATLNILNNIPQVLGTNNIIVSENTTTTINLAQYGYDVEDQNALTWTLNSIITRIPQITAQIQGSTLTIISYFNQIGDALITVGVTDLDRASAAENLTVTIVQGNTGHDITITSTPETEITLKKYNTFDVEYEYDVTAINSDNQPVSFYFTSAPAGMSIINNGSIRWIPKTIGCFAVTIIATDGQHSTNQAYTLCVKNPGKETRAKMNIKVSTFQVEPSCIKPGEDINIIVRLENNGQQEMKATSITATVQELGLIEKKGPIDVDAEEDANKVLMMNIPQDTEPGMHYLRLNAGNDNFQRIVYRDFIVSNECSKLCTE